MKKEGVKEEDKEGPEVCSADESGGYEVRRSRS